MKGRETKAATFTRPPIVVVLGHVDHGKSTLLDFIRKTNTVGKEPGGITQSIGAYQKTVVTKEGRRLITFIDTPGHEAFSSMRSRGAKVADLAILVVAADDGVMPQTIEAISHIRAANIPLVVAINKIDLQPNTDRVKRQLAKEAVLVEGYGGEVVAVPISAKTGEGMEQLLEMVLLISDLAGIGKERKKDKDIFSAVVIESCQDRQRGPSATLIIREGSLKIGEAIMADGEVAKVRNMFDEKGKMVKAANTGEPVEVIGWSKVPPIGSIVKKGEFKKTKAVTPILRKTAKEKDGLLNILIKADSQGALEAVRGGIPQEIRVVFAGIGDISESDILFAKTTESIIVGFRVKVLPSAERLAYLEQVIIKTEEVIYRLTEELTDVIEAFKSGQFRKIQGKAIILKEFVVGGEKIAGVKVNQGLLKRGDVIKLMRGKEELAETSIKSLRIGKKDVNLVEEGKECGVGFTSPLDFQEGDAIISYRK